MGSSSAATSIQYLPYVSAPSLLRLPRSSSRDRSRLRSVAFPSSSLGSSQATYPRRSLILAGGLFEETLVRDGGMVYTSLVVGSEGLAILLSLCSGGQATVLGNREQVCRCWERRPCAGLAVAPKELVLSIAGSSRHACVFLSIAPAWGLVCIPLPSSSSVEQKWLTGWISAV